eukprot:4077242-Amphidinium_carterae.1
MGIIYMTLYKIATATASTVAGNFNKVVSNATHWQDPLSQMPETRRVNQTYQRLESSTRYGGAQEQCARSLDKEQEVVVIM